MARGLESEHMDIMEYIVQIIVHQEYFSHKIHTQYIHLIAVGNRIFKNIEIHTLVEHRNMIDR